MEKSNQIQIGMLGVIIVLLLAQLSGVFGGNSGGGKSKANDARKQARKNLSQNSTAATNPANTLDLNANATNPGAVTPPVPTGPTTNISFKQEAFDFGTVKEGEKVEHVFKFNNTGKEPLVISNAKGSCGCTVPQWPKEPIPPGGKGEIKVVFDSKNKKGKRNQTVTITANTDPVNTVIRMTGEVLSDGTNGTAANPIQISPGN